MTAIPTASPPNPPYAPGPCVHGFAITPSDTTVFTTATRYLWIGGAGNIEVLLTGDSTAVLIQNIAAGTLLEFSATMVKATGTTASAIVGLY